MYTFVHLVRRHVTRLLGALLILAPTLLWAQAKSGPDRILIFGDSLSAAYGIRQERGWVALLETRLKQEHSRYEVVNASISGETTAGGLSRIARALELHRPRIVVIELGANDGLRGLPVAEMKKNLEEMFAAAKQAGARVLLVGMRMPPNYGEPYTRAFEASFAELAKRHRTGLVPFLFEGFAERTDHFQADRLHPTEAAQPLMLENVWKGLKPML